MDRRRYLSLAGGTSAAALAGCLENDDDSEETGDTGNPDENGDADETQLPGWTDWIPASTVTTDRRIGVVDPETLRTEFPDRVYSQFQVSTLPEAFGFDPSAMDVVVSVGSQSRTVLEVVIGSFDVDEVLTSIGADAENTDEYGGFRMADEGGLAIGESAIIFGERKASIDTQSGDKTALAQENDDWNRMLRETAGSMVITAEQPPLITTRKPTFDVSLIATTFNASDGNQVRAGGYYLFDSESTAGDVLDNQRDALVDHFSGQSDVEVNGVEQRDSLLVIDGETSADSL
jgi:hypothetical protein